MGEHGDWISQRIFETVHYTLVGFFCLEFDVLFDVCNIKC